MSDWRTLPISADSRICILDTNVISELMKAESPWLREWMSHLGASSLYTTTITYAEILFGIARMPPGRRRLNLSEMAHLIFSTEFAERILPFDTRAAECFALLAAEAKQKGHTPGFADVQIASIAMAQGAVVVTRNAKDFVFEGVEIQNPWNS